MTIFQDSLPEGFSCTPLWVSENDASELMSLIDSSEWNNDLGRRTQHYGRRYDYVTGRVKGLNSAAPLPDLLADLAERLYDERVMKSIPDQVIVNEYLVSDELTQGIAAHIDHVHDFGPVIATLSLIEGWSMRFTREGAQPVEYLLEPLSLAVLAGQVRYDWKHAIPPRKFEREGGMKIPRHRRVSVTFRTVSK